MRRFAFWVFFALSVLGLAACGGGGGGGTITTSNITLPTSVQVVSAN